MNQQGNYHHHQQQKPINVQANRSTLTSNLATQLIIKSEVSLSKTVGVHKQSLTSMTIDDVNQKRPTLINHGSIIIEPKGTSSNEINYQDNKRTRIDANNNDDSNTFHVSNAKCSVCQRDCSVFEMTIFTQITLVCFDCQKFHKTSLATKSHLHYQCICGDKTLSIRYACNRCRFDRCSQLGIATAMVMMNNNKKFDVPNVPKPSMSFESTSNQIAVNRFNANKNSNIRVHKVISGGYTSQAQIVIPTSSISRTTSTSNANVSYLGSNSQVRIKQTLRPIRNSSRNSCLIQPLPFGSPPPRPTSFMTYKQPSQSNLIKTTSDQGNLNRQPAYVFLSPPINSSQAAQSITSIASTSTSASPSSIQSKAILVSLVSTPKILPTSSVDIGNNQQQLSQQQNNEQSAFILNSNSTKTPVLLSPHVQLQNQISMVQIRPQSTTSITNQQSSNTQFQIPQQVVACHDNQSKTLHLLHTPSTYISNFHKKRQSITMDNPAIKIARTTDVLMSPSSSELLANTKNENISTNSTITINQIGLVSEIVLPKTANYFMIGKIYKLYRNILGSCSKPKKTFTLIDSDNWIFSQMLTFQNDVMQFHWELMRLDPNVQESLETWKKSIQLSSIPWLEVLVLRICWYSIKRSEFVDQFNCDESQAGNSSSYQRQRLWFEPNGQEPISLRQTGETQNNIHILETMIDFCQALKSFELDEVEIALASSWILFANNTNPLASFSKTSVKSFEMLKHSIHKLLFDYQVSKLETIVMNKPLATYSYKNSKCIKSMASIALNVTNNNSNNNNNKTNNHKFHTMNMLLRFADLSYVAMLLTL